MCCIIDAVPSNPGQTSLRIPAELRDRVAAQARAHGRTLAAEIRAACELALCQRTLWLLQHDPETQARLGPDASAREDQARDAVDHLCLQLFGRRAPVEELLRADIPVNDERPTGEPGVQNFTAGRGRHETA